MNAKSTDGTGIGLNNNKENTYLLTRGTTDSELTADSLAGGAR